MKGLLYIPTDRPCERAIASGAAECEAVTRYEEPPALVVIEHVEGPHLAAHRAALRRVAHEQGLRTLHLTPQRWRAWLDRLLAGVAADAAESDRLTALLDPTGVAYGAGPNKAALLAAALGVDVLHRRDSDLQVAEHDGRSAFPAVLESEAIARPASHAQPLANAGELSDQVRDRTVFFVGSSYWGDPPHDRRSLLALDPELVVRLEQLSSPGASLEELRADVERYFETEPTLRYDTDFYEIDMTGRTELGVSCLATVFRFLPEMPATELLGCDYFQKNLLYQLGQPVLFHSRKMQHRYTAAGARGAGVEAVVAYGLRDLRYLMLWRIWSRHNRTLRADPGRFAHGVRLDVDAYADSLESALAAERDGLSDVAPRFAEIYDAAAAIASQPDAATFARLAETARRSAEQLVHDVAAAVESFGWLVRRWPQLIDAAAAQDPRTLNELHEG